ncbi:hypothetical protein L596_023783 [Steinernema carpocapsae]|uniref:Uncharacterized protein n=1 Tax=Steinernema carpocapsae TaxID=34508 RepID=A0A4U5MER3_STECR|nr:hypothetical protein L596_023783 [Steinernema carpocapsae]
MDPLAVALGVAFQATFAGAFVASGILGCAKNATALTDAPSAKPKSKVLPTQTELPSVTGGVSTSEKSVPSVVPSRKTSEASSQPAVVPTVQKPDTQSKYGDPTSTTKDDDGVYDEGSNTEPLQDVTVF